MLGTHKGGGGGWSSQRLMLLSVPQDDWHGAGSGRWRVPPCSDLGVGAAAVCAVIQSLWDS